MQKRENKSIVVKDLNQLWFDFKKVYPRSLGWITTNWKLSLTFLFILFTAFYLDNIFRELFLSLKGEFFSSIFDFGRWYGNGNLTLYLFLGFYLFGIIFNYNKIRHTGLMIFETYIYSGLITIIFKSLFGRWRPYTNQGDFSFTGFIIGPNDQYAFSSGHAAVSFALSCVLASTTKNVYLKSLFYFFALITAFSRVYHDQHWLSDVVMGSYIGILISTMLIIMHKEKQNNLLNNQ